jgi:hypothetical protein
MKQIVHFYLRRMREPRCSLRFFDSIHGWIKKIDDDRFQPVLKAYGQAVTAYGEAIRPTSSNLLTRRIADEDECRNAVWREMREKTGELLTASTPRNRELGEKIDAILSERGDITLLPADLKTEPLKALLEELYRKIGFDNLCLADVADNLAELNRANWSFTELSKARNDEIEGRFLTPRIMRARNEMEETYQTTISFINAMSIYNGDEDYADIIDQVNQIIEQTACSA